MKNKEVYLGDGLYARQDGFMVILRAPREGGDHWVGLEWEQVEGLLRFLEDAWGLKITVKRANQNANELRETLNAT